MNDAHQHPGGAPVGFITELDSLQAASVIYLRMWCDGPDAQEKVSSDFASVLGHTNGSKALATFERLPRISGWRLNGCA